MKPVFVWSDAWVLAAVAVGGGLKGCGLKDVIAAGELINRALLNSDEIRNALGKLRGTSSPYDAGMTFQRYFERPAVINPARGQAAVNFYNQSLH